MTEPNSISKKKVLLAEDDDSMRRLLAVVIQLQGFEPITARDGLEALEIVLNSEIDAIVTDAVMPNMTGFDLCRIIRQNPAIKDIPIILLTGFEKAAEPESLADLYMTKGEKLQENLANALLKLLTRKAEISD